MRNFTKFKDRLVFKTVAKTADGYGGNTVAESTLITVWGFGTYPKFGTKMSAGKLGYDYDALYTVRYNSTITAGMEFLHGTKRYRILGITVEDNKAYMELISKELV